MVTFSGHWPGEWVTHVHLDSETTGTIFSWYVHEYGYECVPEYAYVAAAAVEHGRDVIVVYECCRHHQHCQGEPVMLLLITCLYLFIPGDTLLCALPGLHCGVGNQYILTITTKNLTCLSVLFNIYFITLYSVVLQPVLRMCWQLKLLIIVINLYGASIVEWVMGT